MSSDPATILHITELQPATVLKIAMKGGRHLNPQVTPQGLTLRAGKSRSASNFSKCTFYGYIISNDPQLGILVLDVQDPPPNGKHYEATVKYIDILTLERVVPQGRPLVEHADPKHPGGKALGTYFAQLFQQPYLVRVKF